MPTSPYASTVFANHPAAYYELNDLATSSVAYDASGNCANGAYTIIDSPVTVRFDSSDTAVQTLDNSTTSRSRLSDAELPSGDSPRTVEFWWQGQSGCGAGPPLVSYGSDFSIGMVRDSDCGLGGDQVWV